jgi:hypothetical protein
MALSVAATAVAHQSAGQPGRSARSSPPPRYGGCCYLPAGTNESLKGTVSTVQEIVNMENVQVEWESSKNQSTDQSDFDFRIKATGGGADHPNQLILVKQHERTGGQKSCHHSQDFCSLLDVRLGARKNKGWPTVQNICLLILVRDGKLC